MSLKLRLRHYKLSIPVLQIIRANLTATRRIAAALASSAQSWQTLPYAVPERRRWLTTANSTVPPLVLDLDPCSLPWQNNNLGFANCAGCGAVAQTAAPSEAGYFSVNRKAVKQYLASQDNSGDLERRHGSVADDVYTSVLRQASPDTLATLRPEECHDAISSSRLDDSLAAKLPPCDRCHELLHHRCALPIKHPSLALIEQFISASPFRHNHVYHIIDAADFPMSVVPNIHKILSLAPQRSKNRRAKHATYHHGRRVEMSFIITRSDLLAPRKEQVDALMPDLVEILRHALGSSGKHVRLGNVRCVSAKRGWWIKELKHDMWRRDGGAWMVGKVNVGKSSLFEVVFPKGRAEDLRFDAAKDVVPLKPTARDKSLVAQVHGRYDEEVLQDAHSEEEWRKESDLLPPPRSETAYPIMPTVSPIPGTTVSPIRIPFRGGTGEFIDLPGLARGDLSSFVLPIHRPELVMTSRVCPEQQVLKPGQSLLLGGLIRIDNANNDMVILAYPFVPIISHVTSTERAQTLSERVSSLPSIVEPKMTETITHAGTFQLEWDVTKKRAGPLTAPSGVGLKAQALPFKVLSADILIEGIGWVELVAQARRRRRLSREDDGRVRNSDTERDVADALDVLHIPKVEVYSPEGKSVSIRRPLGAWQLGGRQDRSRKASSRRKRPRRSMASIDSRKR